jgi:hypothetical protein
VRQASMTRFSSHRAKSKVAAAEDEQNLLMRGLVYGVILSLGVWTTALYLIFF